MLRVLSVLALLLIPGAAQAYPYPTPYDVQGHNVDVIANRSFWVSSGRYYEVVIDLTFVCNAVGYVYASLPKAALPFYASVGLLQEDLLPGNGGSATRRALLPGNPRFIIVNPDIWYCQASDIGNGEWEIQLLVTYWARG